MELIKIFDANLQELGIVDKKTAHINGDWHQTFHCWIVNKKNKEILFQLRSKHKKTYPNLLDTSAAGHLIEFENIMDGVREIQEELNIQIKDSDIYNLGFRVEVDDSENGEKNREYQAVHIANVDKDFATIIPDGIEVSGLFWCKIEDALSLFTGAKNNVEGGFDIRRKYNKMGKANQKSVHQRFYSTNPKILFNHFNNGGEIYRRKISNCNILARTEDKAI